MAGLAVNQNEEHPLGCKSSKLLVKLVLITIPILQTSTPIEYRYELCYSRGLQATRLDVIQVSKVLYSYVHQRPLFKALGSLIWGKGMLCCSQSEKQGTFS